jgi:hypothetical protein
LSAVMEAARELDHAETARVITWMVERCCYQMLRDAPPEAGRDSDPNALGRYLFRRPQ